MSVYKINGYDLFNEVGFVADSDRATADSFEAPAETEPVFSKDWGNGVIEYDLISPVKLKPKVIILKGIITADSMSEYELALFTLSHFAYQNYITLEYVPRNIRINVKIRPDNLNWHRLTTLDGKIAASIQMQFDEVKQPASFIDNSTIPIVFLTDNLGRFYATSDNKLITV